jgi:Uncharacterised protein family (UPF0203)
MNDLTELGLLTGNRRYDTCFLKWYSESEYQIPSLATKVGRLVDAHDIAEYLRGTSAADNNECSVLFKEYSTCVQVNKNDVLTRPELTKSRGLSRSAASINCWKKHGKTTRRTTQHSSGERSVGLKPQPYVSSNLIRVYTGIRIGRLAGMAFGVWRL